MAQDQRSVTNQLNSLIALANKNGLYDAADWLKTRLEADVLQKRETVRVEPVAFNPRQEKLFSKFKESWQLVRMNFDREDLLHFEKLGLIELRTIPYYTSPHGIEAVYTEGRLKSKE